MSPWLIVVAVFMAYRSYKSRKAPLTPSALSFLTPHMVPLLLNSVCAIAGLIYLVTFNSSARFYAAASAVISSLFIVGTNYGVPQVSRAAIRQPLQDYFARCMSGAEFPFLFFVLMFVNDYATQVYGSVIPFGLADYLVGVLMVRRSVWFLGSHGSKAWTGYAVWNRFGNRIWGLLKSREAKVLEFCNLAEIAIGFWLILLIITPARQLMNIFVYWTYLRIKYMAPRSKPGHSAAWSRIDTMTTGLRASMPLLNKPVEFMVKWFHQGM